MRTVFLLLLIIFSSCARKAQKEPPPPVHPKAKKSPAVIVLDPGHGGESFGTKRQKPPHLVEKALTLKCAFKVRECLEQWGYKVRMTRTSDVSLPLQKRVNLAKQWQ